MLFLMKLCLLAKVVFFFYIEDYLVLSKFLTPLSLKPFEKNLRNLNGILLENITKLQFGRCCSRSIGMY